MATPAFRGRVAVGAALTGALVAAVLGLGSCRRAAHDERESRRAGLRAERRARLAERRRRTQAARKHRQRLVHGGMVPNAARRPPTSGGPGAGPGPNRGDVYTDGQGHFLQWNVERGKKDPIYWGTAKRWRKLGQLWASIQSRAGRVSRATLYFRDPRIPDFQERKIELQAPGRLRLTCGKRAVDFTALTPSASRQSKARAQRVALPTHRSPEYLMRRAGTRIYVYLDRPAVTRGSRRVFMGRAGKLQRLEVKDMAFYSDGGSMRFTTNRGKIWLPASLTGAPKKPTFTPLRGKPQRLVAVAAKRGAALRRILGDALYADLSPDAPATPCDLYLPPLKAREPVSSRVAYTSESAPRLTLHVLRGRTLKPMKRHELKLPVGSPIGAAPAPGVFAVHPLKGNPRFYVYDAKRGLVRRPLTSRAATSRSTPNRGREVQINGGRSAVRLMGSSLLPSRKQAPALRFIAHRQRPRSVRLNVPLGPHTVLAAARSRRVFFVATGPYLNTKPATFYRVDPFGPSVRKLTGLGVSRADALFRLLPQAGLLLLRGRSRDDFLVIHDPVRGRSRRVALLPDRQGLRVYPRGKRAELVTVGDQIIDPRQARVVGRVPGLVPLSVSRYDAKRGLLYYTTSPTGGIDYTRIVCFDLTRRKPVGRLDLTQVGHHRKRRGGLNQDKVYALQLRKDGTVLAVAGGPGTGVAPGKPASRIR